MNKKFYLKKKNTPSSIDKKEQSNEDNNISKIFLFPEIIRLWNILSIEKEKDGLLSQNKTECKWCVLLERFKYQF